MSAANELAELIRRGLTRRLSRLPWVIRDRAETNASPVKSTMTREAEVNSEHWRQRHGHGR